MKVTRQVCGAAAVWPKYLLLLPLLEALWSRKEDQTAANAPPRRFKKKKNLN